MRILALLLIVTALGACETIKGAGQDNSNAGQALDDTF